jgi:hypothetical protein
MMSIRRMSLAVSSFACCRYDSRHESDPAVVMVDACLPCPCYLHCPYLDALCTREQQPRLLHHSLKFPRGFILEKFVTWTPYQCEIWASYPKALPSDLESFLIPKP